MTIDNETLEKWAKLGPWVAVGTDPAEGVDCFWIKSHPNPFVRGFTNEIGAVNGSQNDLKRTENAKLIAAAPTLAAEVLRLRNALIAAQTGFQNLVDWTETKDFDDVIEIIDQVLKRGDL